MIDREILDLYGWTDLRPTHGTFEYRNIQRYWFDPASREEVLARLLEENHRRALAEGKAVVGQTGLFE